MRSGRHPHCPPALPISLLLWCLLLVPIPAWALSLGEADVLSALGDPIEVEIVVDDWGGLDPQTIEVALADRDQYESFGLEWLPVLDVLNFHLVGPRLDGSLRLLVSTREPASEPYVELLLSLRWPGGSLLREYVLLFDLPASAQATPALSQPVLDSGRTLYQVHAGEVFWNIGQQFLVAGEAGSLQQMLLALYELNPGAFINDNISLLRADALLQIPTAADLQRIDPDLAQERFDSLWAEGTRVLRAPLPALSGLAPLSAEDVQAPDEPAGLPDERQPGTETGRPRMPGNGWLLPANTPVIMPWRDDLTAAEQEGSLLTARQNTIDTLSQARSLGAAMASGPTNPHLERLSIKAGTLLTTLALQAERRARLQRDWLESRLRVEEALLLTARTSAALNTALQARVEGRANGVGTLPGILALVMLGTLLLALGLIVHLLLQMQSIQARVPAVR